MHFLWTFLFLCVTQFLWLFHMLKITCTKGIKQKNISTWKWNKHNIMKTKSYGIPDCRVASAPNTSIGSLDCHHCVSYTNSPCLASLTARQRAHSPQPYWQARLPLLCKLYQLTLHSPSPFIHYPHPLLPQTIR